MEDLSGVGNEPRLVRDGPTPTGNVLGTLAWLTYKADMHGLSDYQRQLGDIVGKSAEPEITSKSTVPVTSPEQPRKRSKESFVGKTSTPGVNMRYPAPPKKGKKKSVTPLILVTSEGKSEPEGSQRGSVSDGSGDLAPATGDDGSLQSSLPGEPLQLIDIDQVPPLEHFSTATCYYDITSRHLLLL